MSEAGREMTLQEWVDSLPEHHRARRELRDLHIRVHDAEIQADELEAELAHEKAEHAETVDDYQNACRLHEKAKVQLDALLEAAEPFTEKYIARVNQCTRLLDIFSQLARDLKKARTMDCCGQRAHLDAAVIKAVGDAAVSPPASAPTQPTPPPTPDNRSTS